MKQYCGMKQSVDINYIQLIDDVVESHCVLTDFLHILDLFVSKSIELVSN